MTEIDEAGRRIWDISQPLRPGLPVWPGDTAYQEERTWLLEGDCPVNVSRLTLSTHSGAHADAPLHYDPAGEPIGQVGLVPYLGPAQVITAQGAGERIALSEVRAQLRPGVRRVLLRTYDRFPHDAWRSDYRCPSTELVDHLGAAGVVLIGIDSPSLDPETAKDLVGHQAVRRWRMAILEGLVLDGVEDGLYELIAPPLRLEGADAAPVRAILRSL
ncbi:arylformamidase [Phenylobacterium aquaticum]|uniref:arylformamidase n=1 Tax=Phenylobacterium aquaticum TaxID=1763816 RepID=UPI001F5D4B30|nr:arylformamidase [Phenylobacterium aquaticum]MCI3133505.1 arylformamidase [Phenylobacterium aquaticum]